MLSVHDYERRVTVLLSSISAHLETLLALQTFNNPNPPPSYQTLSSLLESFTGNYYRQIRRNWLKEKFELVELLYRIQEKLKTYGLRPYEPSQGFQIKDLKEKWFGLEKEELKFVKNLKREIERLRRDARGKLLKLLKKNSIRIEGIENQDERRHLGWYSFRGKTLSLSALSSLCELTHHDTLIDSTRTM